MYSPNHHSEDVKSNFRDRLRSFVYICKRWWLSWLFPGLLASIPTTYTWSIALDYVDNYNKAIAWTIEKEISTAIDCSEEFKSLNRRNGECFDLHQLSTTAWVTHERVRTIMNSREYYWTNTDYWPVHTEFSYSDGSRPGGELKPADRTWLETTRYTQQGEFLGMLPRYAPNKDHKMYWIPKTYELNPSWWSANFRQASQFQISPENMPTEDDIIKLAEQLRKDLSINSRFSIQGNASPEGSDPAALTDRTNPSYMLNLNLAEERAKYVRDKLLAYTPDLRDKIDQVIWVVNLLTPEDTQALQGILDKQWINLKGNTWIHKLISKYEKWELTLDDSDRATITRVFQRKTIVTHTMSNKLRNEWINTEFNKDTDLTLLPVTLILAMYVLAILVASWIPYARWLGRAYKDVRGENGDKRKKAAESALSPKTKNDARLEVENTKEFMQRIAWN